MNNPRVIVVGAGIVGICCAVNLRLRGLDVALIDRKGVARETSHGNSGVICNSYLLPQARPSLLGRLPAMLANRDPRFRLHYPHLPMLLPWITRFAAYCNQRTMEKRVTPLSYLLSNAIEAHKDLMKLSGSSDYLNDNGWLRLYPDATSFQTTRLERYYYDRYQISYQVLDREGIFELEPALSASFERGIWLDKLPSCRNPGALCRRYAEYFQNMGGNIMDAEVRGLSREGNTWRVHSVPDIPVAEHIVVAAGAWSPQLLGIDGLNNPVAMERGYHLMFEPIKGKELTRSIIDVAGGFVLTPMEDGIRATSATNLVAKDTDPDYTQIDALAPIIRKVFPLGAQTLSHPWMGRRPSTADSLPLIGPSRLHSGLWYAFGHGHLGFTLGPVTGKMVADGITGIAEDPANKAFWPDRFSLREQLL